MSRYLDLFPKMLYISGLDGSSRLITNLLTRVDVIQEALNNASLYYQYDIQDGDTPEIVADKFYNDSELHWVVLMFNQMYDPFYDWPLHYQQFQKYIIDKYGSIENSKLLIHHYEKIITTIDSITNNTTRNIYKIDSNLPFKILGSVATYSSLEDPYTGEIGDAYYTLDDGHLHVWDGKDWIIEFNMKVYNDIIIGNTTKQFFNEEVRLPYTVSIDTSKQMVSCYDDENTLNESKRNIKLIRPDVIPTIKNQFNNIMGV